MEKNVRASLYTAVLLIAIAEIVWLLFGSALFTTAFAFLTGGFMNIFTRWIVPIVIIVGYVLFLMNINKWQVNAEGTKKLRLGALLALIGVALAWLPIPFVGWIVKILMLIAYIMMMLGYGAIVPSFPAAKMAKTASMLLMVGGILGVVGIIPILGYIFDTIAMFVYLVAFIMLIIGWGRIKNAEVAC